MIDLFKQPYRPHNYSHQEVADVAEGRRQRRVKYIVTNWNRLSSAEMAKNLGVALRTIYKLSNGHRGKKKHICGTRNRPGCIILDHETGIYYQSVADAARVLDIPKTSFRDYITARRKSNAITNRFKIV